MQNCIWEKFISGDVLYLLSPPFPQTWTKNCKTSNHITPNLNTTASNRAPRSFSKNILLNERTIWHTVSVCQIVISYRIKLIKASLVLLNSSDFYDTIRQTPILMFHLKSYPYQKLSKILIFLFIHTPFSFFIQLSKNFQWLIHMRRKIAIKKSAHHIIQSASKT